ncbi:hypothetical protein U1Q18_022752 [Sarracenia purpurea var. burkii]
MEKKAASSSFLLSFLIITSCCVAPSHGKTQSEALGNLYRAKLEKNSAVDTSRFEAIQLEHGAGSVFHQQQEQEGLKERDKIRSLPGQPAGVRFDQYSGYVTINETSGRAFFYYFVEAQKSKHSLPLLLWLNGGTIAFHSLHFSSIFFNL